MNKHLEECYRAFRRSFEDDEPLKFWIEEVLQISGGSKKRRISVLKKIGVVPVNAVETNALRSLEEQGLLVSFQDFDTDYFAITLLGIHQYLLNTHDDEPGNGMQTISDCIVEELKKNLPKRQALSIEEVATFVFFLVVSDEAGCVDLKDADFASDSWNLFRSEFLTELQNFATTESFTQLQFRIEGGEKKYRDLKDFMLHNKVLTNQQILIVQNRVFSFASVEMVERFMNSLFFQSELRSDVESRYELALTMKNLRALAYRRCVIDNSDSLFFEAAIRALHY